MQRGSLILVLALGYAMYLFNGVWNFLLQDRTILFYALDFSTRVIFPVLTVTWIRSTGSTLQELGWQPRTRTEFLKEFSVLLFFLVLPYTVFTRIYSNVSWYLPIGPDAPITQPWLTLFGVYSALSAGFPEEYLFRGVALRVIGEARKGYFLIFSSLFFGLAHWETGYENIIRASIFGLLAGIFYLRLRNLWALAVAHCLVDFVILTIIPLFANPAGTAHNSM